MAGQRNRRCDGEQVESRASRAQVRANRANARKSTGPRTAAGRRRSAMNAVTHGIFCRDAVLPGEHTAEYVAFRNLLLDSPGLRPQSALELSIAEQYVLARWKLRRTLAAEQVVHGNISESLSEAARLPAANLADLLRDRERFMSGGGVDDERDEDDDDEDETVAAARAAQVEAMIGPILAMAAATGLPPAATLAASFTTDEHDGAFERVGRYQHRLELSADRALRELRQLRKDLGVDVANLPACPFLEPVPDEEPDEYGDEDATRAGGATSVTMSSSPEESIKMSHHPQRAAPVQNEPNAAVTCAGDGMDGSCARDARTIEVVTPMKLTQAGVERSSRDGKEDPDRM